MFVKCKGIGKQRIQGPPCVTAYPGWDSSGASHDSPKCGIIPEVSPRGLVPSSIYREATLARILNLGKFEESLIK